MENGDEVKASNIIKIYSEILVLLSVKSIVGAGRSGLHCLLHTNEGVILADTINMFHNLALTRLEFSQSL